MPATFVTGDLFGEPNLDALAHGCNCAGAMGRGIAVEFRRRFPAMYVEYKARCQDGRFSLGDVFCWRDEHVTVFNLGTQQSWKTGAELWAVEQAVRQMLEQARRLDLRRIGLPRIGAGLGRLDWETEVRPLLERLGAATPIELVVFETFVTRAPGAPDRD